LFSCGVLDDSCYPFTSQNDVIEKCKITNLNRLKCNKKSLLKIWSSHRMPSRNIVTEYINRIKLYSILNYINFHNFLLFFQEKHHERDKREWSCSNDISSLSRFFSLQKWHLFKTSTRQNSRRPGLLSFGERFWLEFYIKWNTLLGFYNFISSDNIKSLQKFLGSLN
jgi:hypothetical protein